MAVNRVLQFYTPNLKETWILVLSFQKLDPGKHIEWQEFDIWKTNLVYHNACVSFEYPGVFGAIAIAPNYDISAQQAIKLGQTGDVHMDKDGKLFFSQPQPSNPPADHKKITVNNKAGVSLPMIKFVTLDTDDHGYDGQIKTWKDVGNDMSVEIEFTPVVFVYIYKPDDHVVDPTHEVDSGILGTFNLADLDANTDFTIEQDAETENKFTLRIGTP